MIQVEGINKGREKLKIILIEVIKKKFVKSIIESITSNIK